MPLFGLFCAIVSTQTSHSTFAAQVAEEHPNGLPEEEAEAAASMSEENVRSGEKSEPVELDEDLRDLESAPSDVEEPLDECVTSPSLASHSRIYRTDDLMSPLARPSRLLPVPISFAPFSKPRCSRPTRKPKKRKTTRVSRKSPFRPVTPPKVSNGPSSSSLHAKMALSPSIEPKTPKRFERNVDYSLWR